MNKKEQIDVIRGDFKEVQTLLTVVGDETRQLILLVLMENVDCKAGIRVGDLAAKTHLSRPAVSHQLKILKDLGIVGVRGEGTMNFYYIDVRNNRAMFAKMKTLVNDIDGLLPSWSRQNEHLAHTGEYSTERSHQNGNDTDGIEQA